MLNFDLDPNLNEKKLVQPVQDAHNIELIEVPYKPLYQSQTKWRLTKTSNKAAAGSPL